MHLNCDLDLDPSAWEWEDSGGILLPVLTDEVIAPDHILKGRRCKCTTECLSTTYSCRKHGLACSPGCAECRGETCQKIGLQIIDHYDNVGLTETDLQS